MDILRYFSFGVIFLISGCGSISTGGAPDQSFDLSRDLEQLSKEFAVSTAVSNYYKVPVSERKDARDRFISGRMVEIDLQYLKFIRNLTSDKQQLDAATDVLNLTLGIAGTLVSGARSKTNLAAGTAGLTGTKSIVDRDFYYDKSIDALVATMNARRKEALVVILNGMSTDSVDKYPFERALIDLHQYYLAGTLNGAVQFIQSEAAQSQSRSDAEISRIYEITVPTEKQMSLIDSLGNAVSSPSLTLDMACEALLKLGVLKGDLPSKLDDDGARHMLRDRIRVAKSKENESLRDLSLNEIYNVFVSVGMIK